MDNRRRMMLAGKKKWDGVIFDPVSRAFKVPYDIYGGTVDQYGYLENSGKYYSMIVVPVDFTGYNTLRFTTARGQNHVVGYGTAGSYNISDVGTTGIFTKSYQVNTSGDVTKDFDISALNGIYYVKIKSLSNTTSRTVVYIKNICLI